MPPGVDDAAAVRDYADAALHTLRLLLVPASAASLALWALTGAAVVLAVGRGARAWLLTGLAAACLAAQFAIGRALAAPLGSAAMIAGLMIVLGLGGAAYLGSGTGRVLAAEPGRGQRGRGS
jgi:hypothetical protein